MFFSILDGTWKLFTLGYSSYCSGHFYGCLDCWSANVSGCLLVAARVFKVPGHRAGHSPVNPSKGQFVQDAGLVTRKNNWMIEVATSFQQDSTKYEKSRQKVSELTRASYK